MDRLWACPSMRRKAGSTKQRLTRNSSIGTVSDQSSSACRSSLFIGGPLIALGAETGYRRGGPAAKRLACVRRLRSQAATGVRSATCGAVAEPGGYGRPVSDLPRGGRAGGGYGRLAH